MQGRASLNWLAVAVMCLALLVLASHGALAEPAYTAFVFDVTVTYSGGGSYTYTYDLDIVEDLSSPIEGFWLDGAYGVDVTTISHTDTTKYAWRDGEVLQPGEVPSWDGVLGQSGKYLNTGSMPAILWGRASLGTDPQTPGDAGTFTFHSSEPPHDRDWYVSGCGGEYDTDVTTGPSPELSPLMLLLGQGIPILGWIGYRRRRQS
ncbi:MAG: hypothetical protein U9R79_15050 [Armatimonadota bacterium]|nr:hypothetical protein [Armatimonadota bacterium]